MNEIKTEFISDLSGFGAPIGVKISLGDVVVSIFVKPGAGVLEFVRDEPEKRYPDTWAIPLEMSADFVKALRRMHGDLS